MFCGEIERNRKDFARSCGTVPGYLWESCGIVLGKLRDSFEKVKEQLQESCWSFIDMFYISARLIIKENLLWKRFKFAYVNVLN